MENWNRDYLIVLLCFAGLSAGLYGATSQKQANPWSQAQQLQLLSWCETAEQIAGRAWPGGSAETIEQSSTPVLVLSTFPGGADVHLKGGGLATTGAGVFRLEEGVVYTLLVSAPGYRDFRRTFKARGEYHLQVSLQPSSQPLTSRGGSEDA